jgi:hypothetical protein
LIITSPHHIVQRGRNRQVTFAEAADFERTINGSEYLKISTTNRAIRIKRIKYSHPLINGRSDFFEVAVQRQFQRLAPALFPYTACN